MTIANTQITRIACFISPHGYGHAARASAVMSAIHASNPAVAFEIFTQVPQWFFAESLEASFNYHPLLTDIGLVQKNSLKEDLPATLRRLDKFLPFAPELIEALARKLVEPESLCQLVMCDIAPMGIAVARATGMPSVLVENFTWDWIYEGYSACAQPLKPHTNYLRRLFSATDYHIQTEPVCRPQAAGANLTTGPVGRRSRKTPAQICRKLDIPDTTRLVVLTMGGAGWNYTFGEQLSQFKNVYFVIAGGDHDKIQGRPKNLIVLARNSDIFHPDLINAADVVIGKVGYSTLAEVYQAGAPFGYVARAQFRESRALVDYIQKNIPGMAFDEAEFENGSWLAKLPALLDMPKRQPSHINGAAQVAVFINNLLQSSIGQTQ